MNLNKYDIALVLIGVLLLSLPVAYLIGGVVGILTVSILALAIVGNAMFGMRVGLPVKR
jgi:hypothetical protein